MRSGQLTGIPALRAGDYVISGEGTAPIHVGASLLSPSETSLAAVDQIEFDDRLTVSASAAAPKSDLPLWRFVAGLGFRGAVDRVVVLPAATAPRAGYDVKPVMHFHALLLRSTKGAKQASPAQRAGFGKIPTNPERAGQECADFCSGG